MKTVSVIGRDSEVFALKKNLSILIAFIMTVTCLCACSLRDDAEYQNDDTIRIVATIFPEYDWVNNVLGENPAGAEVTMLLDRGVDLHSFQPTADDILKISTCDLFIYVGGESDSWVDDALEESVNDEMIVINLIDILGESVKQEEIVEGMYQRDRGGESEIEYDEHVWLSLRNAAVFTERISDALQSLDAENAELYESNASAYIEKLNMLDNEYTTAVSNARIKTLLFGDRFPFRYLVDDYGLDYYAAFAGCSAETEASFETITFLSGKLDELDLKSIMTIDGTDHRIAETIVENTVLKDQKILTLDSMQSTTTNDIKEGTTYISVMENNLNVLCEALN